MDRKIELVPTNFLFERISEIIPTEKNTVMDKLSKISELIKFATKGVIVSAVRRIIFFRVLDNSISILIKITDIDKESSAKNGSFNDSKIYSESIDLPSNIEAIKNRDIDVNVTINEGIKTLLKLIPFTVVFSDSIHPTKPTD